MGTSSNPDRQKRLNTNASKTMRAPKVTETKVNTQARANEVEAFKASRPGKAGNGSISRGAMIAWAATNPNKKSNAARRLASNRKPKPPKA